MKKVGINQIRMKKTLLSFTLAGAMVLSSSPFSSAIAAPVEKTPISYTITANNGKSDAAHDNKVVKGLKHKERLNMSNTCQKQLAQDPADLKLKNKLPIM